MASKPYLAAAFLCEKVLEQKDEVLSAIRIIDTFFVTIPTELPPGVKPAIEISGLLAFKKSSPGKEAEQHEVRLNVILPSGKLQPAPRRLIEFKPDDLAGCNLILNMRLGVSEYGLYWIDVAVDDEVITKIPFKLLEAQSQSETIH